MAQIITRFNDGSALVFEFDDNTVDDFALELMAMPHRDWPKNVDFIEIPEED